MTVTAPASRYELVGHFRGAAALAVMLFHSFGAHTAVPLWAPLEPVRKLADQGWLGVHVFFVISGYCLAEKIASLAARGRGPGDFLRDRFWRIVPPYWLTLLLVAGLEAAAAPFAGRRWTSALPSSGEALLADLLLLQPLLGTTSLLLVSWTLVVEAGFYLAMALLLAGWPRFGGARGTLLLASGFTLACAWPGIRSENLIMAFWPEFWLGIVAHAGVASGRKAAAISVLLVVGAASLLRPPGLWPHLHLTAVGTAVALLALHRHDAQLARWRPLRWLGAVGVWSYSLYLIHAPLLSKAQNLAGRWIAPESAGHAAVWLASIALALGGAYLFYRFVEAPLESWRHSGRRPNPA